jgi:hypothetical protein
MASFIANHFVHVLAGLVLVSRIGDIGSTWLVSPKLLLEANPLVRRSGYRFAFTSLLACLLPYYNTALGVIVLILSLLVTASNLRGAWVIRTIGEAEYVAIIETALRKSTKIEAFALTLAPAACFGLISGVMWYLSPDPRSWGHYPAVAFAYHAAGVAIFNSLWLRRAFRRAQQPVAAIVVLACAFVPALATGQSPVASSRAAIAVSGCYELAFDSWADTARWHGVPIGYLPPHRVQLDTILNGKMFEMTGKALYALRAAPGVSGGTRRRASNWSFISLDSISVGWTDGFTGTGMRFRWDGDTLRGRIGAFQDAITGDPFPRANAAGIRVPCDASTDSSDPDQARRLASLRRLVEPKPGDVELSHRENADMYAAFGNGPSRDMFFDAFDQRLFAALHQMIARYRQAAGHLPERLGDLAPYAPEPPPDEHWMRDAWGKPVTYVVNGATYELRIEGAPRPGGDTGTVVSPEPK